MVHRCSVALLALQASLELCAGRIRRVEVRAKGTKPVFGGVLDTASARRVIGSRPGRATKQKDALAKDAAKWFGSRGYVVDNVGVTVEALPGGGGEQLVLSAAVLPCGRVRLAVAIPRHATRPHPKMPTPPAHAPSHRSN